MFKFSFEKGILIPSIKALVLEEDEIIGEFRLVPHSEQMYELHLAPLKQKDTINMIRIGQDGLKIIFTYMTKLQKIIAMIPSHEKYAILFAQTCGMTSEGVIKNGFLHGDVMENIEIFGISRGELSCLS